MTLPLRSNGNAVSGSEMISRTVVPTESGLRVFGRYFSLPRDEKERLVFTYETPNIATVNHDGVRYTLRIAKQSGTAIDEFNLRVMPPDGFAVTEATIDGEPARTQTASGYAIDPSRDRVLSLAFDD